MDFQSVIGFLAPLIVIFITQILKKWIASRWAPLLVFVLGGISTLIGVGPQPGAEFVDKMINVAWVSGGATLLYDLYKKLKGSNITKIPIALLAIVLAISLTACASFESNTYKTLYTLGVTYDTALKSANDLYKQQKLNPDQVDKIIGYANAYYVAYQEAVVAFDIYRKTQLAADKEKLITALTIASGKYGEIISYIEKLKTN
jgi:hypothetical protein